VTSRFSNEEHHLKPHSTAFSSSHTFLATVNVPGY
jgi:hypothetical protein